MISIKPIRTKSVLVVDDDVDALLEIAEALYEHDLPVHLASDAVSAIELAFKFKPAFILMDYNLPGKNGVEAVASIQRFLPNATVIMMSGQDDFCLLATTKNTNTFAILKKPLAMESIARFIKNQLDYATANLKVTDLLTINAS